MIAVTRHIPGLLESTAADSTVVFGNEIVARLSHDRTGFALAMIGLGAVGAGRRRGRSLRVARPAVHHVLLAELARELWLCA
jgi:hypothetical protein